MSYHFDPREAAILSHLRDFVKTGRWRNKDHGADKYLKRINEVMLQAPERGMVFADVIALVLVVTQAGAEPESRPGIAWVWDATDAPPFPPDDSTVLTAPGASIEAQIAAASTLHRVSFPFAELPSAAVAALPSVGTAIPILFKGNILELPKPGTWVKLRNCGFQVAQGQLQGVITSRSRLLLWNLNKAAVEEYARRLAQKEISSWLPGSREHWRSTTIHADHDFITLRQVAADAVGPNPLPTAYRSLVRLISYWPSSAEMETACIPARASWEAAQADGYTDPEQWLFAVRLRVVDGTGSTLDLDLFGKDGKEFFKDVISPQDLRTNPEAKGRLLSALDRAMNSLTRASEPKWLEVSFRSFFPEIQNGTTGGRREARYRVFDTKLKYM